MHGGKWCGGGGGGGVRAVLPKLLDKNPRCLIAISKYSIAPKNPNKSKS